MNTREKIGLLLATTMLGSSCAPQAVNANEGPNPITNRDVPIVSPLPREESTLFCKDEKLLHPELELIPLRAEEEESEIIEAFDFTKLDVENFEDYELKSVEDLPIGTVIETLSTTPIYIVPTDYSEKIVTNRNLKQIKVPGGMNFELAQKRTIENDNGESIEIGIIRNTYGGSFYVAALPLSYTSADGLNESFVQNNDSIDRSVSYITTDDDIYPNKVMNVILALANVSEFQDIEGKFRKGESYSHISMIGLDNRQKLYEYKLGHNSAKHKLLAGGACASATGVSTLMHLITGTKVNHLGHPSMYAQGPFAPWAKEVDATVEIWRDQDNIVHRNDLVFEPGKDGYIQMDLSLMASGIDYSLTAEDGVGGPSDVAFVISLSYTDERPIAQTTNMLHMLDEYELYRESEHNTTLSNMENGMMVQHTMDEKMVKIANLLYTSKE